MEARAESLDCMVKLLLIALREDQAPAWPMVHLPIRAVTDMGRPASVDSMKDNPMEIGAVMPVVSTQLVDTGKDMGSWDSSPGENS